MLKLNLALAMACVAGLANAQTTAPVPQAATTPAPASAAKKELAAKVLALMKPAVETLEVTKKQSAVPAPG